MDNPSALTPPSEAAHEALPPVAFHAAEPVGGISLKHSSTTHTDGGIKPSSSTQSLKGATRGHPIPITIQNVDYSVPNRAKKGEQLYLLKNVHGILDAGKMTALMGPSGSGKTTLLDLLAGRKSTGKKSGSMLFAGREASHAFLRRYTGYVEQFDTLLGILTVEEMLMYTAELKRPLSESYAEKREAVDELIELLGLEVCRKTRIGSALVRGISGGQAKRTNIGIALVTNPRVLFLDEPTTGLDSFTANECMVVVQRLAHAGVTVCATIHSPTAFAFSLFDAVLLLVRGQVVYFGTQGDSMFTYFRAALPDGVVNGHTTAAVDEEGGVSGQVNLAEYMTDLITDADRRGKGAELAEYYSKSELSAGVVRRLEALTEHSSAQALPQELERQLQTRRATTTPAWWGLRTFLKYRTTHNYVDPAFLGPRIFDKLIIGLLVMTLYLGIGNDSSSSNIINISAVLFMWAATPGFAAASYIPALVLERGLFVRERNDGLYLVVTYLIAKLIDELMVNAVASLGISAFLFYGVQLQGSFFFFWINYYVAIAVGIILAYFVASISPNMDVANALLPTYAVTLLFFAGFLINVTDIPPWWRWYSYLDFARFSWQGTMINQFESWYNTEVWQDGKTVLEFYGIDGVNKWDYFGLVWCFFIFFFICTWLTLQFKQYQLR